MFFTKDCFLFKKGKSYLFTPLKFCQNYSLLHGTVKEAVSKGQPL